MADYSTIKGFTVQSLASDPYASVEASGTWASTNNTNTGRRGSCGFGTRTAAVAAGGSAPPVGALCETYDGSSWSEVNPLNSPRESVGPGAGSSTAGLCAAGNAAGGDIDNTEKWDGTCWTEVADQNQPKDGGACMGATNTAAVYSGGRHYPPGVGTEGYLVETETWDGTSWTEVGDLSTGRRYVAGVGPSTAAFLMGGAIPPGSTSTAVTETWDGTSWTNSVSFNSARRYLAASGGANAQTGALIFGGTSPTVALTEYFNGTAWTEIADMGTARLSFIGSTIGSTVSALAAFGGPPMTTASEEFVASATVTVAQEGQVWYNTTSTVLKGFKLTPGTGAWSSGGAMNTTRAQCAGAGSQSAGIVAGGVEPAGSVNSETYDGSTWSEGNNLSSVRMQQAGTGGGPQSSALSISGMITTTNVTNVESWNGTSWTETADVNTARHQGGGAGDSNTSGMFFGGETPGTRYDITETFNGTSWTEVADLNTQRTMISGGGPLSAAMGIAGNTSGSGSSYSALTETWDGTSWTEVADLNTARAATMSMVTDSTSAITAGGTVSTSPQVVTESWNGTSWTEVADIATARYNGTGVGTTPAGFIAGGGTSASGGTATEEWTIPQPIEIKTFTAS